MTEREVEIFTVRLCHALNQTFDAAIDRYVAAYKAIQEERDEALISKIANTFIDTFTRGVSK